MVSDLVATIKFGGGYDAPWLVAHGESVDDVRAYLIDSFGLDPTTEETLAELIVNASTMAVGMGNVSKTLKGSVVKSEKTSKPKAEPKAEPVAEEKPDIFALIEAVESVDALTEVWATNKAAFKDPKVAEAFKAKGKALKEAAA